MPRLSDRSIAFLIAAAIFAVYTAGACRTIYVGDSGELVTAVAILGIPHPSGYPLYVLFGKLFALILPIGSIAFRMSLFSALCAAIAVAFVFRIVRETTRSVIAAIFAALLFGLSPSFWGEANVQRVYALNALFVAAAIMLAFRWETRRDDRLLVAAFFVSGLGAANHTFMALFAIVLVLFVLSCRAKLERKTVAAASAAFAIGLLPYAYLPIRSRMNPALDWGNPETLTALMNVVSRHDFWARRWYRAPSDLLTIANDLLKSFPAELTWMGIALAVLGLATLWRSHRVVLLLGIVAANFVAMAFHGSRSDLFIWHRYYIPAYMMLALLAGWGAAAVLELVPRNAGLFLLIVPLWLGWLRYGVNDRHHYRIGEDFSMTLLTTIPPGATLIANDDNILFILMYLLLAEGKRPDIDLVLEGVGGSAPPPLRFDPDLDAVYLTHNPNWNVRGVAIVPVGLAFRVGRAAQPGFSIPPIKDHLDGELDPRIPKDSLTRNLIGHFHYMLGVTNEERDWLRARKEFATAMSSDPNDDVLFYNIALIFARNGLFDDAIAALERSKAINARDLPSGTHANAGTRLELVTRERDRVRVLERELGASMPSLAPADAHREMSVRLTRVDEPVAARGHLLRALELAATETVR